jgi:dTDP-4-dehydrorhamnose reductase
VSRPQRWLVVGAAGMLGQDLVEVAATAGHAVLGMDLPQIDITSRESVREAMAAAKPDVVVNAAAFTAVDAAEDDEARALRINGQGPRVLAAALERYHARLVQLSTDYVFSGAATAPYPEDAVPEPVSAYGRTKLSGEVAVRAALPSRAYVVRTAWLYGAHGRSFVGDMLGFAATRPELSVVDDQRGQPTWTRDLAAQIVALVGSEAPAGIYHGTSSGETTWFGLAREIFRLIGADPERVRPTTSDQFPRPAPRPPYSVLGHDRWSAVGLKPIRRWDVALAEALPHLMRARVLGPS